MKPKNLPAKVISILALMLTFFLPFKALAISQYETLKDNGDSVTVGVLNEGNLICSYVPTGTEPQNCQPAHTLDQAPIMDWNLVTPPQNKGFHGARYAHVAPKDQLANVSNFYFDLAPAKEQLRQNGKLDGHILHATAHIPNGPNFGAILFLFLNENNEPVGNVTINLERDIFLTTSAPRAMR